MLEALVSVARRAGIDTTVEHLLRSHVLGEREPDSRLMVAIAHGLGLEGRIVSMRWDELFQLKKALPAIIRLRDGTTLVLESLREDAVAGKLVVLHDPAAGADAM